MERNAHMDYYEQPLWIRMLEDWLMGMTIEEKIKDFQRGKLEICVKCGEVFFDKETPGQRRWVSCFTPDSKHDCIELENYLILMKSFRGILFMVTYPDHTSAVDAICEFFKGRAREKSHQHGKPSRFRF